MLPAPNARHTTCDCALFAAGGRGCERGNSVWIAGFNELLHWDGTSLLLHDLKSLPSPTRLWGFASDDVWGGGGTSTLHWNGTTWSAGSIGLGSVPTTIWGCSPDDLWLGGPRGTLLHRML